MFKAKFAVRKSAQNTESKASTMNVKPGGT
jgi:hypothetical protein